MGPCFGKPVVFSPGLVNEVRVHKIFTSFRKTVYGSVYS